jgi:hypothetical protein
MLEISWVASQLADTQEGLSSMSEWVSEQWSKFCVIKEMIIYRKKCIKINPVSILLILIL